MPNHLRLVSLLAFMTLFAIRAHAAPSDGGSPAPTPVPTPVTKPAPTPVPEPTPMPDQIRAKILGAGVTAESLDRILGFIDRNKDQDLLTEVYTCRGQDPANLKPCDERLRDRTTKKIHIIQPRYVASVDFTKPSIIERLFVIDLQTGAVQKFLVTHGKGSGISKWAYKFSNIKDSDQSALGLYQVGEPYLGGNGQTMRLYGLETSDDQAYNRDIVMHSADYARADFITRVNPNTHKPYGRLGLSWGCPAVSPEALAIVMPLLKNGGILDLYQPQLMQASLSGHEVSIPAPPEAELRNRTEAELE